MSCKKFSSLSVSFYTQESVGLHASDMVRSHERKNGSYYVELAYTVPICIAVSYSVTSLIVTRCTCNKSVVLSIDTYCGSWSYHRAFVRLFKNCLNNVTLMYYKCSICHIKVVHSQSTIQCKSKHYYRIYLIKRPTLNKRPPRISAHLE